MRPCARRNHEAKQNTAQVAVEAAPGNTIRVERMLKWLNNAERVAKAILAEQSEPAHERPITPEAALLHLGARRGQYQIIHPKAMLHEQPELARIESDPRFLAIGAPGAEDPATRQHHGSTTQPTDEDPLSGTDGDTPGPARSRSWW